MSNPANLAQLDELHTDRSNIVLLAPEHAPLMARYYRENWSHLKCWEPRRGEHYFSVEGWQRMIERYRQNHQFGVSANFAALNLGRNEVIAVANFTNIVHGVAQCCNLGYSIAQKYQGQGLMFEVLQRLLPHMMRHYQLHRINANHMPQNERSAKLLKRLGFAKEGYAKALLKIDGQWQDHVLNALINPSI